MDPVEYRRESRRRWGAAAGAWAARAAVAREETMPVSMWMVDAIAPQPGHRVLELAAGTGDVGFLAAELIAPGGELITSDFAPEMLSAAQERAAALGLENVRFKQIDAESIDLEAGSLDGVLCRWGYMLMADPQAALRETRRVLKPGGRVALAAWAANEDNPWSSLFGRELRRLGFDEPTEPGAPDQFAWAEPGVIEEELASVGFVDDIRVEDVTWTIARPDFDTWWTTTLALAPRMHQIVEALRGQDGERYRAAVREAAEPFTQPDGSLALPARTWVASAAA